MNVKIGINEKASGKINILQCTPLHWHVNSIATGEQLFAIGGHFILAGPRITNIHDEMIRIKILIEK